MSVTNGYCTVAELRNAIGDDSQKLQTTALEAAISAASRWIDRRCGRRFWLDASTQARLFRPETATKMWVYDIGDTTGLTIETGTGGTFDTTLSASDYVLGPLASEEFGPYAYWTISTVNGVTFPMDGWQPTVRVTAKFGWSEVPPQVQQACLLRAASLFKRKDAPFGVAGFGDFGAVRVRPDIDVDALLADYMTPGFA